MRATGVGLGLRRSILAHTAEMPAGTFDFLEVAPENWIDVGGSYGRQLTTLAERFPLICHGLSLSLGGYCPLDETFLHRVKRFLQRYNVPLYSEHLSACSDDGQLYDLMPIPFTEAAVRHVAARIGRVQDIIGCRMAIENVSYYTPLASDMSELDFTNAVLERADCELLLDVNNVYVNSVNHGYDANTFIDGLDLSRVVYLHIAGHYQEAPDLLIDTHGAAIIAPVFALLESVYRRLGPVPTLLERDFNFAQADLRAELQHIRTLQAQVHSAQQRRA